MKPSPVWLIVLVLSVLANGVLIGFLAHQSADGPQWSAGREAAGGPQSGDRGPRAAFDMRGFVRALPPEAREATFNQVRDTFDDMGPLIEDAGTARREVEALMIADSFDAEAVAAALDRLHASHRAIERRVEGTVLTVLDGLDAETRRAALQAGIDRPGFDPDRSRRAGPPPGGPRPDGPRPDRPDGNQPD